MTAYPLLPRKNRYHEAFTEDTLVYGTHLRLKALLTEKFIPSECATVLARKRGRSPEQLRLTV
jgi:hypothetical protein